jgi:hypothetical protein
VEVIATPGDAVATVLDHTLTVASHPFLASHVLGGRPVLPIAMMIEWMSHAALHDHPDLLLQGLDDLRVFRPIALDRDRLNLRLKVGAALGDDPAVVIELAGATAGEGETVHARATVRLGRSLDLPPTEAAPRATDERPYERGVEGAYRDVLFHGAYLQGIEQIIAISARGISARLRSAPPPREWMLEPLRSAWLTDPLLLDAALQLPILWCHEELSSLCLPMSVGGYRQFVRALPASGVVARCAARRPGAREIVADISLLDAQSAIVAILRDCRFTVDASLERAFHDAREPAAAS